MSNNNAQIAQSSQSEPPNDPEIVVTNQDENNQPTPTPVNLDQKVSNIETFLQNKF